MKNRTLSTLPISVGTGLAIEAITSEMMFKYSSLLINIRTLVRNAHESFSEEDQPTKEELFEAVKEDMLSIAETLSSMKLRIEINIIFYYPSYKGMKSMFPLAKLKTIENLKPKQQSVYKFREEVCEMIVDHFDKAITKCNVMIPDFKGDGLIMTSFPVDLATSSSYTRLTLLESHTGALKPYTKFYSKLTNGDNLTNIPLNKLTIQVFGDGARQFYAMNKTIKNVIEELANIAKWNSSSTPSFVYRSIRSLNHTPDKEILLKMI